MKIKLLHTFYLTCILFVIGYLPAHAQLTYCATTNAGGNGSMINNVTFNTLSNNTAATNPTASPFYTSSTATTTVIAGSSVPLTIEIDGPGTSYTGAVVSIWIDYNQDGVFAATEWQQVSLNIPAGTNYTMNVNIPSTATTGLTGMRIRSRGTGNQNGSTDACTGMGSGETEDYYITISPASACTGIPAPGNTVASVAAVCPNGSVTLSVQNPPFTTGITYQWETYNPATSTWVAVTGATSPSYTTTQTAATDYRALVTCTNGGGNAYSTPVTVTMNTFLSCYCASAATTTGDEEIFNVTFAGLNNSSVCNVTAPGPGSIANRYSNYKTTVTAPQVMQGQNVSLSIGIGTCGGNYQSGTAVFIDLNQDGDYTDAGEQVYATTGMTNGPHTVTGFAQIPITATVGTTTMRVINAEGYNGTSITPCLSYGYGETEDYIIDIIAAQPCAGNPTAGTVTGPTAVCSGSNFTMFLNGTTVATGITVQWQKYDAATSTWINVTGATSNAYTVTGGITAATDFRALVTCTNGGGTDISNTLSITLNPFYNCYCSPNTGVTLHSYVWNYINNVTIPSTTLNSSNTTAGPGGYLQLSPTTLSNTASLTQGVQYTINVTNTYSGNYMPGIWIDFNQSGTFDATEFIPVTTSGNLSSATFIVPITATPGLTGLRVREYYTSFSATQPCYDPYDGETEDYLITIVQTVACAGTPNATTISGPTSVCSGANFTLSASGFSTGIGITYQWEKYDAATSAWVAIVGATNPTYTVTGGQTTASDYRFITTCTNGGATDISNTLNITMNQFYLCYCSPLTGVTLHSYSWNYINNVTIPGTTLNSSNTTTPTNGYLQLSPTTASNTASLQQGVQYTINVTNVYSGNYIPGIWIDFNQSGTFDAGEQVTLTTSGTTSTGTFIVPITAATGLTGLRVREYYSTFSGTQACYDPYDGETEDYLVTITAALPCSGTPNATTATGPSSVCSGANFTLNATNFTTGLGITYQWEKYDAATTSWVPIVGATNPSYTVTGGQTVATDYRFVTTCTNGPATTISNTLTVTMNAFFACYCASAATTTGDEEILNVTVGTLNNTSTCNVAAPGPGSMYNQYSNFTTTVAAPPLGQSSSVSFSIGVGTCGGNYPSGTAIFIDFNQDGDYTDAGEQVYGTTGTTNGPHTVTGSFTIPATALLGQTGMRVINAEGYAGTTITPCLSYGFGETEDYVVNITTPPACIQPSGLATGSVTANSAVVNWNASSSGPSNYNYYYSTSSTSPTGTTTPSGTVSGTTTTATLSGLTAATTYYVWVRSDCGAAGPSTWAGPLTFVTQCAAIMAPWTYDVENQAGTPNNTVMSNCWTSTPSNNTAAYAWTVSMFGTTPSGTTGPSTAHSGTKYFFTEASYGTTGSTTELISPVIDLTAVSTPQLEFWYHMYGATMGTLETYVSNNGGSTWNLVNTITGQQQTSETAPWLQQTVLLTGYTGNIQIKFKGISAGTFTGDMSIDDISIVQAPSCLPPTGLAANNVTATSADVTWTAVTGASGYQYAIDQTSTAAPNAATTVNTAANNTPATFTGLTGGTTYYLHVRTNCGASGFSTWSVYTFSTPPPNDPCANAINLTNGPAITGTTSGATQSMIPCDATVTANDVWYSFTTGSISGSVTINVNTTVGDIVLEVFSGTCGAFTPMVATASSAGTNLSCIDQVATGLDWGTYTVSANTTYYVRVYGYFSANSTFTIGAVGTPLAIKLSEISATNVGARNRIDWRSETEMTGDKYEVERSADGSNFTYMGTVNAKGQPSVYSYWDETPVTGVNHYRLKMTDGAGNSAYSKVVTANVKSGSFTVEAYPNPVSEMLTVRVYGAAASNPVISVSDATGKIVKMVSVENNEAIINMSSFAQGMYLVKYSDNNHTQTIKVNKQ
jgi:hypothetical protein